MTRPQVSATRAVTFCIESVLWSLAETVMKLVESFNNIIALSFIGEIRQRGANYSMCSKIFCSDISVQGGVGVKSSRKSVFIWFRRQGKGEGRIDSRRVAVVRETALPFGLEAANVPVDATIGSAQIRGTLTGLRSGTTTVFTGRLSEGVQQEASTSQAKVSLLHLDGKSGDGCVR